MGLKAHLRVRIPHSNAHYGGNLVSGAHLLEFFGDIATELLIRHDGDEGLFRAYESVDFLAPVYGGDYLEIEGEIIAAGKTSRTMSFVAKKYITPEPKLGASAASVLLKPVIVAKAKGTCVVPKELQRLTRGGS